SPVANRMHSKLEGLIGFFVNMLTLRTDTSGDPRFSELLKRVQKAALGAYDHQELPFERLVQELDPGRDLSRNPLFQISFALQNSSSGEQRLSGLRVSPALGDAAVSTRFDLEIHVWEKAERLSLSFVYNTDLFDRSTIEQMARHYVRLLEGIV